MIHYGTHTKADRDSDIFKYSCSSCEIKSDSKTEVAEHIKLIHRDETASIIGINCLRCEQDIPHKKCIFAIPIFKTP